jgi:cyanoexosortase A
MDDNISNFGKHIVYKLSSDIRYLLLILSGLLVTFQFYIFSKLDDGRLSEIFIIFGSAILYLIWEKRLQLELTASFFASLVGGSIIGLVLIKSAFLAEYDPFLRFIPLLFAIGLILIASGFKGSTQYLRELFLLCFFAPSPTALTSIFDLSPYTAKLGADILFYLNVPVQREGVYIYLQGGGVEVYSGCSGIEAVLHLLGLSAILIVMFPMSWTFKLILPIIAMSVAFFINGFRVAIMAVLSTSPQKDAFEYWHKGTGSLIFSLISVLIFGLIFYFLVYRPSTLKNVDDF